MDHESFRRRQRRLRLDNVAHLPVEVAYTDVGSGTPLLLLHGIPTWSFLYHDVIDRLAEHHRVIAPDFLGHGWSDRRDLFDRSLVAQRAMILALLDALDLQRVDLIGHDTGGGVALMMAIEDPERIGRLVLSNIVAYDSWPIDDMIGLGHPGWRHRPPLVISFFRGAWCPYCMIELEALAAAAARIEETGATLVAITPQTVSRSEKMVSEKGITFDVLTDEGLRYAEKLGLAFDLPADLADIYRGFGIDVGAANGDGAWRLPMPARLVVLPNGVVAHAVTDPDYTVRPDPQETLAVLQQLGAEA